MRAVPLGQSCPGFVRAFAEVEYRLVGRGRRADVAVLQDELAELAIPISRGGVHWFRVQAGRAGRAVRVERSLPEAAVAGPESATGHLVRIGLARHPIGALLWGSGTAGKARHGQIEGTPEEMHRTALAQKSAAEFFKDPLTLDEDAAEAVDILGVIGCVVPVLIE